jgi:hypothetical protein
VDTRQWSGQGEHLHRGIVGRDRRGRITHTDCPALVEVNGCGGQQLVDDGRRGGAFACDPGRAGTANLSAPKNPDGLVERIIFKGVSGAPGGVS